VSDLTKEEIKSLIITGWSCDDYKGVCKIQSHKGVKNNIIYDPTGKISLNEIADDSNFEGNAAILHTGQVVGKLTKEELTEDAMIIPPGKFVFFMSRECVNVPFDVDGSLFMNPRVSNLGLHFFTLGHIDPGFHGHLTATLLNMTNQPIKLGRNEGCLYLVLGKTDKVEEPHQRFHEKPQLTLEEAQKNLSFNLKTCFALTSDDFATKDDLDKWRNMLLMIIFGVFGIGFSTIVGVILWLLGRIPPAG
jgi:deoxycytidine triphosphate deaminase